jgi:hypothetical protein
MRNLPMILLALAPALMLPACNRQEKQEMASALARAEAAAQRAESAQHAAESAAARARTDKLAAANSHGDPADEADTGPEPEANSEPEQDVDRSTPEPG